MTSFRLRWKKLGGHVHVRVFSGPVNPNNTTHGKNGDLCFTEAEWDDFLSCFTDMRGNRITVLPED